MLTFASYIADLAERRSIRRSLNEGQATYRILGIRGATLTVITEELDELKPSRVLSEPWPVPITSLAHTDFLRKALSFNRSALHHLPCGILLDEVNTSLYRLTWSVPSVPAQAEVWRHRLQLFSALADKAWATLPTPGQSGADRAPAGNDQHVIFMP